MKRFILATAIALTASNTIALENNFYLKSTYGAVDTDISTQEALERFETKLSDPSGWSITLGYHLNNHIAFEGGFIDLGDAKGSYRHEESSIGDWGGTNYERHIYDYTLSTEATILGLFFTTDITKDFYAGIRIGYQFWDEHLQEKDDVFFWDWDEYEDIITTHKTNDGSDLYYGISVGWNYNKWSLNLEHTTFEMEKREPRLSSLALTYNF
ncbi:outer membrane beta-barrel protein [Microbulbifer variabilis]|uniref:Outer membrane beta-barrel protein n=1 Tax=Microbulbifer variabilis TaxID=266805 RepID=A0ABY4VGJ6_9GAMM|nr:outer membrane beta-barrel protein [Microbulbifer variabilis]USD21069.1 outer membrane beta-barrel protein [Microbulbifer variabilis]